MADSYNELFGLGSHTGDPSLLAHWRMQDDAASDQITDSAGAFHGAHSGGNTNGLSVAGPSTAPWLPKALRFDGTNRGDMPSFGVTVSGAAVFCWFKSTGNQNRYGAFYSIGRGTFKLQSDINYNDRLGFRWDYSPANTDPLTGTYTEDVWSFGGFGCDADGMVIQLDDETASDAVEYGEITLDDGGGGHWIADDGYGNESPVDLAGICVFSRKPSFPEISQIKAGPEPLNTVAPTLTIDTSSWSGTVGSWDSQSNGSITCAWELRDADDDSVIESGTGSSPSGSGSYSGDYYLWVRGSNLGGHDSAEDSVSSTETASGGVGGGFAPWLAAPAGQLLNCGVI
ncbi:hypothetical protein [Roseiconus lacunae]|uniref:Fibronectin type-III domain-containing protein n=1 Tax=Roseiconus lacunae TaxID=2605694 RepID=A0ABT7PEP4_9BACT|nr:hypothetical protein [Roseiconus lacunae]MDM4014958.1 hypothetical protein [Roseiconus lacunae]